MDTDPAGVAHRTKQCLAHCRLAPTDGSPRDSFRPGAPGSPVAAMNDFIEWPAVVQSASCGGELAKYSVFPVDERHNDVYADELFARICAGGIEQRWRGRPRGSQDSDSMVCFPASGRRRGRVLAAAAVLAACGSRQPSDPGANVPARAAAPSADPAVTPAELGHLTAGIDQVQAWQEEFYKHTPTATRTYGAKKRLPQPGTKATTQSSRRSVPTRSWKSVPRVVGTTAMATPSPRSSPALTWMPSP